MTDSCNSDNDGNGRDTMLAVDGAALRAIMDTVVDGLIIIDSSGTVRTFNRACERLFGYAAEDTIGRNIKMLMPNPYHDEHDGYISEYLKTGVRRIIGIGREVTGRRKDGSEFPMDLAVGEFHERGERVFVGIIRDITERKKSEAGLAATMEELEAYAYSVAHDLKAPLRAMHVFAEALAEDYNDKLDDQGREYIRHITNGANHMGGLIDDLLAYSRVGRGELTFEAVSMGEVLEDVLESLSADIAASGATIETDDAFPTIEANRGTLALIMQNLIANAMRFVAEDCRPVVRISAHVIDNEVDFSVADNGIGIEPDQTERIFGLFMRLNPASAYVGSGVGLAIVKKAVGLHNGLVWVVSKPGQGAAFHVHLPLHQPHT